MLSLCLCLSVSLVEGPVHRITNLKDLFDITEMENLYIGIINIKPSVCMTLSRVEEATLIFD